MTISNSQSGINFFAEVRDVEHFCGKFCVTCSILYPFCSDAPVLSSIHLSNEIAEINNRRRRRGRRQQQHQDTSLSVPVLNGNHQSLTL